MILKRRIAGIKNKQAVVTEYEAPLAIPPAFFGTMVDNHNSSANMYATLLSLHYKGYIRIRYDTSQGDYYLITQGKQPEGLMRHELYLLKLVPDKNDRILWAKAFEERSQSLYTNFNFALIQDLQEAGYYFFYKNIYGLNPSEYAWTVGLRAVGKGLIKPWNWPGIYLSFIFLPFGIAWLLISLFYYNRLGLFNYRTKKWDELWPSLAGYYTYLQVVEAKKREADPIETEGDVQIFEHDPYLAAADMQPKWRHIFVKVREIGAKTKDYDTYKA